MYTIWQQTTTASGPIQNSKARPKPTEKVHYHNLDGPEEAPLATTIGIISVIFVIIPYSLIILSDIPIMLSQLGVTSYVTDIMTRCIHTRNRKGSRSEAWT